MMVLRHASGPWWWLATVALAWPTTGSTPLAPVGASASTDSPLSLSQGAYNPSLVSYRQSYVLISRISEFPGRPLSRGGLRLTEVPNRCELCVGDASLSGSFSCSPWDPWQGLFRECRCAACQALQLLPARARPRAAAASSWPAPLTELRLADNRARQVGGHHL